MKRGWEKHQVRWCFSALGADCQAARASNERHGRGVPTSPQRDSASWVTTYTIGPFREGSFGQMNPYAGSPTVQRHLARPILAIRPQRVEWSPGS